MKPVVRAVASVGIASSATIPTVKLNNGVEMPMISLGTWQYDSHTAESAVKLALKVGFNHIDTANDYGNQDGVGRALRGLDRSSYFVTTKVPPGSEAQTRKRLQDDLDQLGLDYVDLMLVHYPPFLGGCKQMQDQWKAMEAFYAAGKAKAIGVSNYCTSSLKCIAGVATVTPAVNQIQFHVGMGIDPTGLKSYCDSKGIHVQAYSPLGDGTKELITGDLVTGIGKAHNMTGAQVSLRWLIETGVPLTTKTTKQSHMEADLGIFGFSLEDAEKSQLDAATSPSGKPSFSCRSIEDTIGGHHYERPPCEADETQAGIQGVKGVVCAPACSSNKCPTDAVAGVTAKPECALSDPLGNKYCVLECTSSDECDKAGGAKCALIQPPKGVCLYPGTASPDAAQMTMDSPSLVV